MKLFISHSHAREEITKGLCALLKANDIPYWISFNRIHGGQTWDGEVIQNLSEADLVLLIMTPEAAKSQNVEKEFKFALNKNIPIIPVTVGCAMPEAFSFHLMNTLTLDYATDATFQQSLICSIQAALGQPCDEDAVATVALPPIDANAETLVVPVAPEKPAADTPKTVPLKKLWIPTIAGGMVLILLVVLLLFQSCSHGTPADHGVTTTTTTAASVDNESTTTTTEATTTIEATTTTTEATTTVTTKAPTKAPAKTTVATTKAPVKTTVATTKATSPHLSSQRFVNNSIDDRVKPNCINVLPYEAYFDSSTGKFVINAYVANTFSYTMSNVNIRTIEVRDKNGVLFAVGTFPADQHFNLGPNKYVTWTYTFSSDAITSFYADISTLDLHFEYSYNN